MAGAVMAEKVEAHARDHGAGTDERDEGDQPVAKEEPHRNGIGCAHRYVEGQTAQLERVTPKSGSAGSSSSIATGIGQRHSSRSIR